MKKTLRFLGVATLAASLVLPAAAQIVGGNNQPNFKNLVDNGNFNIAQRGTASATSITTVSKYLQDRWAGVSGTSTTATLSNVTSSLPTQFTNAAQLQRNSAQTGVVKTCLVQEIPTADITALAGQPVTLSFWALVGANFSAANSALVAQVTTGTGADEGLATWLTGFAGAASAIPTANATVTGTTSWQRFAVTGTLAANTTEAVVNLCWTPVGTAGTSDYVQVTGVQLEQGTVATNFEWRPLGVELAKVERYYWQWAETVSTTNASPFICSAQSTTVAVCTAPVHVPFRVAPTIACTAGTMKRMVAGTDTTVSACAAAATTNGISQVDAVAITATVASGDTAGFAGTLMSGNSTGGGLITASSDF